MTFSQPISQLIHQRYSCRSYRTDPIDVNTSQAMARLIATLPPGPFQSSNRFEWIAATAQERDALRGLGTYGFIKDPTAFIIGVAKEGPMTLEDFGYRMEEIILFATELGLGTCWLGGTFTRSAFARKVSLQSDEIIPAVTSTGFPAQSPDRPRDRLGWETLLFDGQFNHPLSKEASGIYAVPLENIHIAPSASNKQPWRVVKQGSLWHFYMQRTPRYREMALSRFTGIADMQRIDMGIAMCHFELSVVEAGGKGCWEIREPAIDRPDMLTQYVVTWKEI